MSRRRTSVIVDTLDVHLRQLVNQNLRPFTDQISSDEQHSKVLHCRSSELRSDIVQRCKLRNDSYRCKLPRYLEQLQLNRNTVESFRCKANSHDQSVRLYQRLIQIQASPSIEISCYQQQLEQSMKILKTLTTDVHQYEKDIEQFRQELSQQTEQMHFYSTNLFQIQFEQVKVQSDIKQLKEQIRHDEAVHQNIKQQFSDLSSSSPILPNEPQMVFDRETLRKKFLRQPSAMPIKANDRQIFRQQQIIECEKQQLALAELKKERQTLIDRETILNSDLQKLRDSNQTETNIFLSESTQLSSQIETTQLDLERLLVDFLPLKFEIDVYQSLLDTQEKRSIRAVDHLSSTDQCQMTFASSEQPPSPSAREKLERIKCELSEGKEKGERLARLTSCMSVQWIQCVLPSQSFQIKEKRVETRFRSVISGRLLVRVRHAIILSQLSMSKHLRHFLSPFLSLSTCL